MNEGSAGIEVLVSVLESVVDAAPDAIVTVKNTLEKLKDHTLEQPSGDERTVSLCERVALAFAQHVFAAGVYDILQEKRELR